MALTTGQLLMLKTDILARPELAAFVANGQDNQITAFYNAEDPTPVKAWRSSVPPAEVDDAPDYSTFDSLAAGKRDSWGFFLARERDFTRNKVRKWVADVWGNATAGSNSEAILQAATENARRIEVLFGGPTRTTGTVSAIARSFVGTISDADVAQALRG